MSSRADRRSSALFIGYGSSLRGDDRAGIVAAERLAALGFRTLTVPQLAPELAADVAAAVEVFFLDASASVPPGEVRVTLLEPEALRAGVLEHHATPGGILRLAEEVYGARVPATLIAIGAESFALSEELSEPARRGICQAVELLLTRCGGAPNQPGPTQHR